MLTCLAAHTEGFGLFITSLLKVRVVFGEFLKVGITAIAINLTVESES